MPTYDYECEKCGKKFEIFHSMTAEPIKKCPDCKGKVHKLIGGGSGIIFKGTGFYETDYKKKSGGKKACKENKSGPCKGCSLGNGGSD